MNTIKTYTIYSLMCLVLFSCYDKKARCYTCNKKSSLQVAEFISSNIKNANNMSDEEMEDVISELKKTGIVLYCDQEFLPCTFDNQIIWGEISKDSSKTYHPYIY